MSGPTPRCSRGSTASSTRGGKSRHAKWVFVFKFHYSRLTISFQVRHDRRHDRALLGGRVRLVGRPARRGFWLQGGVLQLLRLRPAGEVCRSAREEVLHHGSFERRLLPTVGPLPALASSLVRGCVNCSQLILENTESTSRLIVFIWFLEKGVFLARCFISWVVPDMTTILRARDKSLKERSEVGKTRLLGLATPSSRAVGLWWRAASGLRPRPRRRRLRSRRPGTRSRRRRPRPPSSRDARWWKRAAARPRRPSLSQPL